MAILSFCQLTPVLQTRLHLSVTYVLSGREMICTALSWDLAEGLELAAAHRHTDSLWLQEKGWGGLLRIFLIGTLCAVKLALHGLDP